jgi:6-phosphogluconate dehydrogenase
MRVAVVGAGTVGAGLAAALVERGHAVVVWDADEERLAAFVRRQLGKAVQRAPDLPALVGATATPRLVLVDEAPGDGVDEILAALRPLLARGDVIAHVGVEAAARTGARAEALEATGVGYLGIGVAADARTVERGPALLVGGTQRAVSALEPVLASIAAREESGAAAIEWLGPDGAGHLAQAAADALVAMDLELLVEACDLLRLAGDARPDELAGIVADWGAAGPMRSELAGPLVDAVARVMATAEGTRPLIDRVLDVVEGAPRQGPAAGARLAAAEAGARAVPSAMLAATLEARALGAAKGERVGAARVLAGPIPGQRYTESRSALVENVRDAYAAARWVAAAFVVELLERSMTAAGGPLRADPPTVLRLLRVGTLVGAGFAARAADAAARTAQVARSILLDTEVTALLRDRQVGWRNAVALGVQHGVALPAMAAALATYDGLRRERHAAYLIAAVENAVGLSDFRRTDREGTHHHEWADPDDLT